MVKLKIIFLTNLIIFMHSILWPAQDIRIAKVCYVNIQTILEFHPSSKDIILEMKQIREKFKSEIEALEKEVRELEQKVKNEGPSMSQSGLRTLLANLESKKEALRDGISRRNDQLMSLQNTKLQPIYQQILEDTKKFASSLGYHIVLDSRYVLIGAPELDITEALKRILMSRR